MPKVKIPHTHKDGRFRVPPFRPGTAKYLKNKKESVLPLQGVWVSSLVRELRSHMLHGVAKKKKLFFK